ncbi:Alcohol acetyltransferase/N-acetyltransferase [Trinorchestia longiramus]|nr:Alcohol acetyltransferase/N-acetyltransferase [Trinorchestia longiramus]
MGKYRYRENGPAWSVRFLPRSPKQDEFMNFTKMEKTEGILKKLPHVSHLIFSYHHSIADGFTCVRLARNFLTLLDDVIAGNAIDDTVQYARMLDVDKQNAAMDEIQKSFEADPELLKERTESYLRCASESFLSQAYPQPSKRSPEIVCLPRSLDSKTTAKFTARCKKEGVTFHTGFCSVLEATVVRVLQEANVNREKYPIGGLHSVDQRCYWKGEEEAFGVGLGILDCTYEWPKDVLQNFWANAKQFHKLFKDQHSKKSSMEHAIIENLTGQTPLFFISSEGLDSPPSKIVTYATTNMRNVDGFFGDCGEHVRLIYYDRLSTVQGLSAMWLSTFQTFDGQLMHSFQYNTQLIDNSLANKMADATLQTLREVSDMP